MGLLHLYRVHKIQSQLITDTDYKSKKKLDGVNLAGLVMMWAWGVVDSLGGLF